MTWSCKVIENPLTYTKFLHLLPRVGNEFFPKPTYWLQEKVLLFCFYFILFSI